MERVSSEKEEVKILIEVLVNKGIKQMVLSPGSRNAPLIMACMREEELQHFVILDERSAAFFALGLAQQSGKPVALACTSGTALLNYAPAVAEAYYQRIPLIVLSADRPEEWIDQDDSQTIRQDGVLANLVKASYRLPAEICREEDRWFANRIVNDAVNCALKGRRGPVHINVPLREPLYGLRSYVPETSRTIRYVDTAPVLEQAEIKVLAQQWTVCPKVMILAGCHAPDSRLKKALARLSALKNVVLLTETLSNAGNDRGIGTIDRVLSALPEDKRKEYAPELLVTFGGPLISKQIKSFLRTYPPEEHWSIDRSEHPADTFQAMTVQVNLEAEDFFPALGDEIQDTVESDYAARWQERKEEAGQIHTAYVEAAPWCDLKAFSVLLPSLPAGSRLQVANSTPVRYAQLFEYSQVERMDGNRGTSGIDGSTSTAAGAAVAFQGMTVLITGDMGFLYDSNALWNPYLPARMKIIVMKNGGGSIFRFIPGPSELEELEECFETVQEVNVEGFARIHGLNYYRAGGVEELETVLPAFWYEQDRPALLEIVTPRRENARLLKGYFESLKNKR